MAPRPVRTIRRSLAKKCFIEENSHHLYLHLCVDGQITRIHTYISHGAQECGDHLLGIMAKQLKLSRAELNGLIDCGMSGEAYIESLKEHGYL